MTRLAIYAIIALAVIGAITATVVGIYRKGVDAGKAEVKLEWEQANRAQHAKEEKQISAAGTVLEETRAKDKVIFKSIVQQVDRIVDRVEYRAVCLDARGLCIANAAIRGEGAAACGVSGPMPTSWETRGRDGGHALALDSGSFGVLQGLRGAAPGS